MIESLFLGLALAGAFIAGYTDLKKGIVPNKLTLPLIAMGILGNSLHALYSGDVLLVLDLAKSLLSMFIVGYVLWIAGGWSAGDAKELLFLAALLPRQPAILKNAFNPASAPYPFSLTILVDTFLLAFPFLVIYSLMISYGRLAPSELLRPFFNIKGYVKNSFYIVSAAAFSVLVKTPLASLIALAFFFWLRTKEAYKYAASLFVILMLLMTEGGIIPLVRYFVILTISLMLLGLLWNALQVLSGALKEEIKISELKPGKVLAEEIYVRGGEVIRDKRSLAEKLRSLVTSEEERKKFLERKLLVSTRAAGVGKQEIEILERYVREGKLEDRIMIKKAMPFAPVILIGLIASLTVGDLLEVLR